MNDLKTAWKQLSEWGVWPSMRKKPTDKQLIHLAECADFHLKQQEEVARTLKEWSEV